MERHQTELYPMFLVEGDHLNKDCRNERNSAVDSHFFRYVMHLT